MVLFFFKAKFKLNFWLINHSHVFCSNMLWIPFCGWFHEFYPKHWKSFFFSKRKFFLDFLFSKSFWAIFFKNYFRNFFSQKKPENIFWFSWTFFERFGWVQGFLCLISLFNWHKLFFIKFVKGRKFLMKKILWKIYQIQQNNQLFLK